MFTLISITLNFFLLSIGKGSKTKTTDEDDQRFIDAILLDSNQTASLITAKGSARVDILFSIRSTQTTALNKHEMEDHLFKGGAASFLPEVIRDEMLPATALPLMLKHKNGIDPISSVSSGCLMQDENAFHAIEFLVETQIWQ